MGEPFTLEIHPCYSFLSVEASLDQVCWKINIFTDIITHIQLEYNFN